MQTRRRALRGAHDPRAPCAPAPSLLQGHPASAPTRFVASPRRDPALALPRSTCLVRGPDPAAAVSTAASAVSPAARAAPLRQSAAPQSPLPDFHFLSL